ncbi:MAG: 6-hydroxycyclohex-1-ene-1-carbonyl-CoA dehydrogenase [Deltaproteobacteria bacterium]|nr:6-hydroxycyclohex-1-ene-1-carbonyl-CoA dehydrogenase [Deltaproteobacteria bacterium]
MTTSINGWALIEPEKPLQKQTIEVAAPGQGEVLVEVAGCGVCHTDISFAYLGVKTRMTPPLILGHEISGTVVEVGPQADQSLKGKAVLVPAVLPCGECDLCKAGQRRICRSQVMPGNDRHGGFASHVVVPAKYVCPIKDEVLAKHELWELSIVSDAVTTPFQAIKLSELKEGELAICIGVGGIGIHCVQIAAAAGAKVIALDVDDKKLEVAKAAGAKAVVNVAGLSGKEVKGQVKTVAKEIGAAKFCRKIFETSGTKPGQETGFNLLTFGSTMLVVGFTMDKVEVRLSNLMAFDSRLIGIWGCDPVLYPEVLEWLAAGRIQVKPYVEKHSLDQINQVFEDAHHGKLERRAVLVP